MISFYLCHDSLSCDLMMLVKCILSTISKRFESNKILPFNSVKREDKNIEMSSSQSHQRGMKCKSYEKWKNIRLKCNVHTAAIKLVIEHWGRVVSYNIVNTLDMRLGISTLVASGRYVVNSYHQSI
ncbi:CLUMA_CG007937, isoform A [Clunio marinus]|uniref:CLUMA_CG007937, isoform A n=1 Tax=Clunio marinus TaxID=568069 RepID=A0A1J1I671_9DIPT|nr:CLUMA_CG007937, isoform A [Clunio marinus]